ncbi:MAG: acyl-CoA reductase [Limisphaerales bacterium]
MRDALPNYFLLDTQPEARLTPEVVTEACRQLKRNRAQYLRDMPTEQVITLLSRLAENWQDDLFPFRKMALEAEPTVTGFSRPSLAHGLDRFFARITEDNLHNLIAQELGDSRRLDAPLSTPEERFDNRLAFARGPELIGHIASGNLPCPTMMSMIQGLLVGSAQFIKCAQDSDWLPAVFAHSLYDAHPKLGACIELAHWPGGKSELESPLFNEADCITATGRDETLASIQARLDSRRRFIGYGHRVSFAYIQKDMLSRALSRDLAQRMAQDIASWNQLGCLSPHLVYVEQGGAVRPEMFAEMVAEALDSLEATQPRGDISPEESGTIAYKRDFYDVRSAGAGDVRQWKSEEGTHWTVVFEEDPVFTTSCLNRFIHVKPVGDLDEMLRVAEMARGQVSTVGLAAPKNDAETIVKQLAHWGVTRVCPIGQMQDPPLGWRHDGRPPLGDLVTWTDWEQ